MRAWILEGHGYDNLNLVNDVPVPAVGERDVLIKRKLLGCERYSADDPTVKAAALNYRDTNILHVRWRRKVRTDIADSSG